ncbi:MAG: helix-turn-helix domain-containing protein, partial [Pseudomonadota bacterium]
FREDLYYRLCEIAVNIPALRERQGEAAVLVNHFINQEAEQQNKGPMTLSQDALAAIDAYSWPGNIRELANRVKRAVIMADGKQITAQALELEADSDDAMPFNLREVRKQAESQAVLRALSYAKGNVSQAATLLGITRPTFYALVNKYNLGQGQSGREEADQAAES